MGSILLGNPLALSEASTRFAHLLSFARLLHVLFSYAISLRITWDDHIPIDFCSVQSSNCREASRPNMTASMTGEPGDRGHVRDRVRRQPEVIVIMLAELVTSMS